MKKIVMRNEIISAIMFASFIWVSVPTIVALLVFALTDYSHPLHDLSGGMLFAGGVYCVVFLLCWNGFATEDRASVADEGSAPGGQGKEEAKRAIPLDDEGESVQRFFEEIAKEDKWTVEMLPSTLLEAAQDPLDARAVVYQQILAQTDTVRRRQLILLERLVDAEVYRVIHRLIRRSGLVAPELCLALTERAVASLRHLSASQYVEFKSNLNEMFALDSGISPLEWSLRMVVFHHLDTAFDLRHTAGEGKKNLDSCYTSVLMMLSILALVDGQISKKALDAGAAHLDMTPKTMPVLDISHEQLDQSLEELRHLDPQQKPTLLCALAVCAVADRDTRPINFVLVRVIAAVLNCPMPSLTLRKRALVGIRWTG